MLGAVQVSGGWDSEVSDRFSVTPEGGSWLTTPSYWTVLDTTRPRELAEFYRQLLGLSYRPDDEPPVEGT